MMTREEYIEQYNVFSERKLIAPEIESFSDMFEKVYVYISDPGKSGPGAGSGKVYISADGSSGFRNVGGKQKWVAVYADLKPEMKEVLTSYCCEGRIGSLKAVTQVNSQGYQVVWLTDALFIAKYPVTVVSDEETAEWYDAVVADAIRGEEVGEKYSSLDEFITDAEGF